MKLALMAICAMLGACVLGAETSIAEKTSAPENGNTEVQFGPRWYYSNGEGVAQDTVRALRAASRKTRRVVPKLQDTARALREASRKNRRHSKEHESRRKAFLFVLAFLIFSIFKWIRGKDRSADPAKDSKSQAGTEATEDVK